MTSNTESKNKATPVLIVVSIVAVLALAASVLFGLGWKSAMDERDTAEVRDSALVGAQQAAINLTSVDSSDIDGAFETMLSSVTGDEMTSYLEETRASVTDEARDSGRSITAELMNGSLTELNEDDGTATAVVIIANTVNGPDGTATERTRAVFRLSMLRVDGTWKATNLMPVGDRVPIDAEQSPVYGEEAPAEPEAAPAEPEADTPAPDETGGP